MTGLACSLVKHTIKSRKATDKTTSFLYLVYVKKAKVNQIDFVIDKLTNSIENILTGDSFPTDISIITKEDLKVINKKTGWLFDWNKEAKLADRDVYKLTIVNNSAIIQGLVSLTVMEDHVVMHLIESAPFNKGKTKVYAGIPGNLVAFACKLSFQRGCEGYVSFIAKTKLIDHYIKTLGAVHVGAQRMVINTVAALKLIDKYFPK